LLRWISSSASCSGKLRQLTRYGSVTRAPVASVMTVPGEPSPRSQRNNSTRRTLPSRGSPPSRVTTTSDVQGRRSKARHHLSGTIAGQVRPVRTKLGAGPSSAGVPSPSPQTRAWRASAPSGARTDTVRSSWTDGQVSRDALPACRFSNQIRARHLLHQYEALATIAPRTPADPWRDAN